MFEALDRPTQISVDTSISVTENLVISNESLNAAPQMEEAAVVANTAVAPATPPKPVVRYGMTPITLPDTPWDTPYIREYDNSSGAKDYDIFIFSAIGYVSNFATDIINILNHATSESTIRFYIQSPGGNLETGSQICSAMSQTKAHVITIACGMCASAACLIWCYGKEKIMEPGSYLMFHLSSHMDWGNSEDIRRRADTLVKYVKFIAFDPMIEEGILTEKEVEDIIVKRMDLFIDSETIMSRLKNKTSKDKS